MKTLIAALALTATLTVAGSPALADVFRFDVMDPNATLGSQPFKNYYFLIDGATKPVSSDDFGFSYDTTDFGSTYSPDTIMDQVSFYNANFGGGFLNNFTDAGGPVVFSGAPSSPTFLVGSYTLDSGVTLKISDTSAPAVSAAPEPASWALMMGGVAMLGALFRRNRARRLEVKERLPATA